jgi:hypothetical protein
VLDGEIVALDCHGKTQFKDLVFRRGEPRFYAFDLLWCAQSTASPNTGIRPVFLSRYIEFACNSAYQARECTEIRAVTAEAETAPRPTDANRYNA